MFEKSFIVYEEMWDDQLIIITYTNPHSKGFHDPIRPMRTNDQYRASLWINDNTIVKNRFSNSYPKLTYEQVRKIMNTKKLTFTKKK